MKNKLPGNCSDSVIDCTIANIDTKVKKILRKH